MTRIMRSDNEDRDAREIDLDNSAEKIGHAVGFESERPVTGAWITLAVLTMIYWFGTLDRMVTALLVPDIKADLHLTDVQLSLIQGLAFGLLYMLLSPLSGWLVDRLSRRGLLFCAAVGWSLSSMASGLCRSFGTLFAARAGVGGFESTLNPASYSLLSDVFPPKKLALPLSIYVLGGNLGTAMSFLMGGAILALVLSQPPIVLPLFGHLAGWQTAFLLTGVPGLVITPLLWFVRDPRRRPARPADATTYRQLWHHVRDHKRFYVLHHLGFGIVMSLIVGLQSWNASYLARNFAWGLPKIGYVLGATQLLAAVVGLALHGWLVDRLFSRGRLDAHVRYFLVMVLLALPCGIIAYSAHDAFVMITFWNILYFFVMSFASIGPAALQIGTPSLLRGKASSIYMLSITIMGTIMGPIFVALISDYVFSEAQIGKSMVLFTILVCSLAAVVFALALRPMRELVATQIAAR